MPGTAAPHSGAGVQNVVPCKPRFARPIRWLRVLLGGRISGVCNTARAVEHHPRRAPDGEPPCPFESQSELEEVLGREAAYKRLSKRRLERGADGKECVQVLHTISRNRRQLFIIADDDFEVYVRPAVGLARKRAYYDNALNAAIVAQQAGYSLGSFLSLLRRKTGTFATILFDPGMLGCGVVSCEVARRRSGTFTLPAPADAA